MSGIVEDILTKLLHNGKAIAKPYLTSGKGTKGSTEVFLAEINDIVPAITVQNQGPVAVNIGAKGVANFSLAVNQSYTYRWKNPAREGLCVSDGGTVCTLQIIS